MHKHTIIYLCYLAILSSCLRGEPDRHDGFESISDCYVYEYEIQSDSYHFGTVEYIDTSIASGCVKAQLQNTFLLNLKDSIVVVYGDHPKNHIDEIKKQYQNHLSDTTKLIYFTKTPEGYSITIGRLCKDLSHFRNNTFVEWKDMEFKEYNSSFKKTEEKILTFWYDWNK
jgi:bifunctional N-acetylglucosamine-1-phosphate-uridyltransferase/glucosamine-1-phosphate-acetyltransferase GlmU-like protein